MSFPNVGHPPKTERNAALYADRLANPSERWEDTGARYGISETMARIVFQRVRRRLGGAGKSATPDQMRQWGRMGGLARWRRNG